MSKRKQLCVCGVLGGLALLMTVWWTVTLLVFDDDPQSATSRVPARERQLTTRSEHHQQGAAWSAVTYSPFFVKLQCLEAVALNVTWGYAHARNAARWGIIRSSLADKLPRRWLNSQTALSAIDLGADQGYFSVSMLHLLSVVSSASHHRPTVFAVEKGGFGGAFWQQKEFAASNTTVHDVIRQRFNSLQHAVGSMKACRGTHQGAEQTSGESPSLFLCPTQITRQLLERSMLSSAPGKTVSGSSRCSVSLLMALSMLHWVDGVDGFEGFARTVCTMALAADVVILELPHPAARKTFGEARYRQWYGRRRDANVTQVLERALLTCPSMQRIAAPGAACAFVVEIVGATPWGRGLYRQIHRIDRICNTPSHEGDGANEDPRHMTCIEDFRCHRV